MKILLVQSLAYIPSFGGANKANRILIEGLAAGGHDCRVVAAAVPDADPRAQAQLRAELSARGISVSSSNPGKLVFRHLDVEVHAATDGFHLRSELKEQMREFGPDCTLVSCEDPAQALLAAALEIDSSRVVSVVQTTLALPFGPASFLASPAKAALFKQTAGVITICHYLKDYMFEWGGIHSTIIVPPVFGKGPFPHYRNFDDGLVTMINPSAIKGISIFVALARDFPAVNFAAVPTWATTNADRACLQRLPNVRIMDPADDIDEILARSRALLMPSLWGEAFGYVVPEAMLRGIPVLASNVGGVPEAKLGVEYILPVNPITRYEERLDHRRLPVPVIPQQNITPWRQALEELLSDRTHYEQLSVASREAALSYVSRTGIAPFEQYLKNLTTASPAQPSNQQASTKTPSLKTNATLLQQLSPERRAVLALKLKGKYNKS